VIKLKSECKRKRPCGDEVTADTNDVPSNVNIPCDVACTCGSRKSGTRCDHVRENWNSIVWPLRLALNVASDYERRAYLLTYMTVADEEPTRTYRRVNCTHCDGACEGHFRKPNPKYTLPIFGGSTVRVCRRVFLAATKSYFTVHALNAVMKAMNGDGPMMPHPRGGARHFLDLEELGKMHDFIQNKVPKENSHYSLTVQHDPNQVVLAATWYPTKIYWEYMLVSDPTYYAQQMRLRVLKSQDKELPEDEIKLIPKISLSSARKYMRRLCYRVGSEHKDRCGTCYRHELHIKLGQDVRATATVKRKGARHAKLKERHQQRAWRAYQQCAAERALCLHLNDLQRGLPPVECKCKLPTADCKCKYKTREGSVHIQMDKGSKLGLPMLAVNVLWYKSRMWMIVEHVTDTSQEGKGRRTAHMWEEADAAGGSANMISVLHHHLKNVQSGRKGLTLWMDNCWHELKNWDLFFYLHWLVLIEKMFDWVEVKYYESGHSYMGGFGPDSTHAKITNAGKNVDRKAVPEDWYNIAEQCNNGQIRVVRFKPEDHRNWRVFLGQCFKVETGVGSQNNVDSEGRPVNLPAYRYLRIEGGELSGYLQAWEELDSKAERVFIRCLKKKYPTTVNDNPNYNPCDEADPMGMPRNRLRLNGVLGVVAAWDYLTEDEQNTWHSILLGAEVTSKDEKGIFTLTEEVLQQMKTKATVKSSDEEPTDDEANGTGRRHREGVRLRREASRKAKIAATSKARKLIAGRGSASKKNKNAGQGKTPKRKR
jgi:hypothetical protein